MKKHAWKIIVGVVVLLIGGSILLSQQAANKANEGVVIEPRIKGNPDAAVTLVEYSDFECPACAQFYPYLKDVVDKYGADLRFEYKHFPLVTVHPKAVPAAIAAEAAGQQGKFWEMHDLLFENQATWANSVNANAYFEEYAEEIGLDVGLFRRHMDSSLIRDAVNADFEEARSLGLSGTPTLILNGEEMVIETFGDLDTQVAAAIASTVSGTQD